MTRTGSLPGLRLSPFKRLLMPPLPIKNAPLKFLLPAVLAALIFAPIIWRLAITGYDYQVHMAAAANLQETGTISSPHFLLQYGGIWLSPLLGGIFNATVAVVLLAVAGTAVIVARFIQSGSKPFWLVILMTLTLLLAAPVAILYPLDRHLYFGYIGINVFHNPTIFLLKPLALLSFCFAVNALANVRLPITTTVVSAILTVAAAVAKPSYTIVILPALAIIMICLFIMQRRIDWKFILFSIFIPAVIILLLQYQRTYSSSQLQGIYDGKNGIIFAPLAVMKAGSAFLLPKLLLSLLFPLAVLLTSFREAIRDTGLQLGWLLCGVACIYTYLLAESGPRMLQGNFVWSAQIAFFILFVASAKLFLKSSIHASEGVTKAKVILGGAALMLHLSFGIAFYIAEFARTELYW